MILKCHKKNCWLNKVQLFLEIVNSKPPKKTNFMRIWQSTEDEQCRSFGRKGQFWPVATPDQQKAKQRSRQKCLFIQIKATQTACSHLGSKFRLTIFWGLISSNYYYYFLAYITHSCITQLIEKPEGKRGRRRTHRGRRPHREEKKKRKGKQKRDGGCQPWRRNCPLRQNTWEKKEKWNSAHFFFFPTWWNMWRNTAMWDPRCSENSLRADRWQSRN